MKKSVGIVSEDDDFSDAKLVLIDIDNAPPEFKYISRYLEGMNSPNGATKQIMTKIAQNESCSYNFIYQLLYFSEEMVFFVVRWRKQLSRICYKSFTKAFAGNIF